MAKRGNFFIRLCYGYVGRYKDTKKMTTREVVEEFLNRIGVSSPREFFQNKFKCKTKASATQNANSKLKKTIETLKTKKIKFSEGFVEKCREIENTTRTSKIEVGTVLDKNGNIINQQDGSSNQVTIDKRFLKDAVFTHNHPKGTMFSTDDIKGFLEGELYQLRASTPSGKVFVLTREQDFVSPSLVFDYDKAGKRGTEGEIEVQRLFEEYSQYYGGYTALEKAVSDYKEMWLKKNAKKYHVKFEVEWDD